MDTNPPSRDPNKLPPPGFRWEDLEVFGPSLSSSELPPQPAKQIPLRQPRSLYPALIASALLPGLSNILHGEFRQGFTLAAPYLLVLPIFWLTVRNFIGLVFLPFLLYLWVLGLFAAYQSVKRSNHPSFSPH